MFGLSTKPLHWSRLGQTRGPHLELILLFPGLVALGFAIFYTAHFAIDQFDYRVLGSRLVCEQPLNNRCVTHYSIREAGMDTPTDHTIFGYQFAEGEMRAGNEVRKTGIGFVYSVNGRAKTWSYGYEMSLWVACALFALLFSYRWHRILRGDPVPKIGR